MSHAITIHVDESCLNNQAVGTKRAGACAGFFVLDGTEYSFAFPSPNTTNNRMALLSAIIPLRSIPDDVEITFVSDSSYLCQGASDWMYRWEGNGWRKKGGAIENLELWQELHERITTRRAPVTFTWVRGHAANAGNNSADQRAVLAARTQVGHNTLADAFASAATPSSAAPVPAQDLGDDVTGPLAPEDALRRIWAIARQQPSGRLAEIEILCSRAVGDIAGAPDRSPSNSEGREKKEGRTS